MLEHLSDVELVERYLEAVKDYGAKSAEAREYDEEAKARGTMRMGAAFMVLGERRERARMESMAKLDVLDQFEASRVAARVLTTEGGVDTVARATDAAIDALRKARVLR